MRSRLSKRVNRTKLKIEYSILIKIAIIVLLYLILFWGLSYIFQRSVSIKKFEESISAFSIKNTETLFQIDEINLFSSAYAKTNDQKLGIDISRLY